MSIVRVDAAALPFRTAELDAVLLAGSASHSSAMRSVLAESARVLRPGGLARERSSGADRHESLGLRSAFRLGLDRCRRLACRARVRRADRGDLDLRRARELDHRPHAFLGANRAARLKHEGRCIEFTVRLDDLVAHEAVGINASDINFPAAWPQAHERTCPFAAQPPADDDLVALLDRVQHADLQITEPALGIELGPGCTAGRLRLPPGGKIPGLLADDIRREEVCPLTLFDHSTD